jgi:hypothetical protein
MRIVARCERRVRAGEGILYKNLINNCLDEKIKQI